MGSSKNDAGTESTLIHVGSHHPRIQSRDQGARSPSIAF